MYSIQIATQKAGQPLEDVKFEEKHRLEKPEEAARIFFDATRTEGQDEKAFSKWTEEFIQNIAAGKRGIGGFLHSEQQPTTLIITGSKGKGGIRMRIIKEEN